MTARPVLESRQHLSTWGWASPDPPRAGSRARRGTGAGAAPPGQLGTALGTQECGTGSRSTGCASAGPSGAPPAPADPTGRGREPSRDCCPPAMFPRLMCASQRHSPEPAGKALRCDTLRRPPSSAFAASGPERMCRAGSHGGAGAARPRRSRQGHLSPRPPAGATRAPSSSPARTQPQVPAGTRPGRAAPGDPPPPRRSETQREMRNEPPRAPDLAGERRDGSASVTVPAGDTARLAAPPAPGAGDVPRAGERCSARSPLCPRTDTRGGSAGPGDAQVTLPSAALRLPR